MPLTLSRSFISRTQQLRNDGRAVVTIALAQRLRDPVVAPEPIAITDVRNERVNSRQLELAVRLAALLKD